MPELADIWTV